MYIFAEDIETGEIFEVLNLELYQGDVLFAEFMDRNGSTIPEDYPQGYKYTMQNKNEGGNDNN